MNTAAKGRRNDNKSIELLAGLGLSEFMKSAASKGKFDLVCWNHNVSAYVQSKTNNIPPQDELLRLMNLKVPKCAFAFLFIWHDKKPFPSIYLIEQGEMTYLTFDELKSKMEVYGY